MCVCVCLREGDIYVCVCGYVCVHLSLSEVCVV